MTEIMQDLLANFRPKPYKETTKVELILYKQQFLLKLEDLSVEVNLTPDSAEKDRALTLITYLFGKIHEINPNKAGIKEQK